MRYKFQPFLGNQLACLTADTVSLVLDPDQSGLQRMDELELPLCQLPRLFLGQGGCSLLEDLECRRSVLRVIAGVVGDGRTELLIVIAGLFQLLQNDFLELLQLFIARKKCQRPLKRRASP